MAAAGDPVFVKYWGGPGSGNSAFLNAQSVAVNMGTGNVYVVDRDNNRVQKFDANGTYLGKWGSGPSSDNGSFNSPYGVAVDTAGNVYVSDWGNNRVQKFDSNGNFLTKWGISGSGDGQFDVPTGVAVAGDGYV